MQMLASDVSRYCRNSTTPSADLQLQTRDSQNGWTLSLSAAYLTVSLISAIQLIRVLHRAPQSRWTTQKVFQLLNPFLFLCRAIDIGLRSQEQSPSLASPLVDLNNLTGLFFVTTYGLLALFWAETYEQAKGQSATWLWPTFAILQLVMYWMKGILIIVGTCDPLQRTSEVATFWFSLGVSLCTALACSSYSRGVMSMLRIVPLEPAYRSKRLFQVGTVSALCTLSFCTRAALVVWPNLVSKSNAVFSVTKPLNRVSIYLATELFPAIVVLFILGELPKPKSRGGTPKRVHSPRPAFSGELVNNTDGPQLNRTVSKSSLFPAQRTASINTTSMSSPHFIPELPVEALAATRRPSLQLPLSHRSALSPRTPFDTAEEKTPKFCG